MDGESTLDSDPAGTVIRAARFCEQLVVQRVRYDMDIVRDDAVMVTVAVPGERWEIEFMSDGTVEVERFESTGVESVADPLAMLIAALGD
jgi:hypothetical protein